MTRRPYAVPLIILIAGLLATLAAAVQLHRVIRADDAQRFANVAEQKLTAIRARLDNHISVLRGGAGLFAASEDVSRGDFAAYVDRLLVNERYPGVQGIGFSRRVVAAELDPFIAEARGEIAPDFRVIPAEPRDEYHAIIYLEPLDERNRAAIGFDMFTDPVRREAMERARDSGQPAASGKVELVQEIDENKQAGFLIYMPVYATGALPPTVEQRRAGLDGFVYSPYRAGDLFASLFEWEVDPQLDFAVYDGPPEAENLLYDSHPLTDEAGALDARFTAAETIEVAGRNWTVALASSPAFERGSGRELTPLVAAGGVLATLLLSGLAWSQGQATRAEVAAREEVVRLAASLEERVVDRTIELREAQTELRQLNASLEATIAERTRDLAQANEEIQRFAYIVSHDLRAPLVNVMGFTSELGVGLEAVRAFFAQIPAADDPALRDARAAVEEDMPEAIGFIRASTSKMDGLINAILRLSREGLRTLSPERVNMAELLHSATDSVRHQLGEAGGDLIVELPIPDVISDRLALEQIFGNLIDNAVKYLDRDRPGRIVIRGGETETGVEYEVEDNGRGIAAEDRERIFDLFRRAGTQDRPGEGIGLSHVRTLVRRLGGDIGLESSLGKGTIFRVRLPRKLPVSGDRP